MDSDMIKVMETMIDIGLKHRTEKADLLINLTKNVEQNKLPCPMKVMFEVKESKYGRGIFATEDIPAFTVLTLYPIHLHLTRREGDMAEICGNEGEWDEDYSLNSKDGKTAYWGDKNKTHPAFSGHLFNDFCDFTQEFKTAKDKAEISIKYILHAKMFQTAHFKFYKHLVGIETYKDIKKGDEICVAYSPVYWLETMSQAEFGELLANYIKKQEPKKQMFLAKMIKEYLEGI
jgi:hypothetical protein